MIIKDTLGVDTRPLDKGRDKTISGRAKSEAGAETQAGQDKVILSDKSKEAVRATEIASVPTPSRQEKIAELKERIENNEYHVPSDQIAGRMIVDFLKEIA